MPLTVHFHLKTPFLKEHLTLNWLLTFPLYDRNQKTFMNRLNGLLSAHLQPSSLDPFGHFLKRFEAFDTWISDLCHLFFWRGALVTTRLTFLMFFLSEASPFRQPSPLFHLSFPRHRGPAPQQGCFTPEVLKASQPPTQISLPCHYLFHYISFWMSPAPSVPSTSSGLVLFRFHFFPGQHRTYCVSI